MPLISDLMITTITNIKKDDLKKHSSKGYKMRKLIFVTGTITILSLLCGITSCLSPYEDHMKRGAIAMSNGNYDEAITEFTKVMEIAPDNESGYYARASAYYRKGKYDLAINDFTKAIQLNPKRVDPDYNGRGLSYSAKGDYQSAISDFTKAIEIYPNPLYYNNRGLAYHSQKNYDLAIQDFTAAINLAPHDARPYSNRADSYIATGQVSLAIVDLRKVIELSGDDPLLMQSARERLKNLGVTE